MLGLSIRGRHIHSTLPLAAISADTSQSDRKPFSAIGGNGLPRSVDRLGRGLPVSLSVTGWTPFAGCKVSFGTGSLRASAHGPCSPDALVTV
jgi:hypothetical protein